MKRTFGAVVRQRRQERKITLRGFAGMIGMSPTYLSKIERDELPPPAPDKLVEIARRLGFDQDEFFALAERLPSDIPEIIHRQPAVADLLRRVRGWPDAKVRQLTLDLGAGKPKSAPPPGPGTNSSGGPGRRRKPGGES